MPDIDGLKNKREKARGEHYSRFFPGGRNLADKQAELFEEQRSIIFSPGRMVGGRFEIVGELGFGGGGAVYRAKDHLLHDQLVALKVLLPSLGRSKEAREGIISGVRTARELRHEGIAALYDIGEDREGKFLFLVMELLDGRNLADYLISKGGILGFTEACDILLRICDVMVYAHDKGFIYGTLKPENIFILPGGKVKLLDFGLVKLLSPYRVNPFCHGSGIDWYMAPEQLMGNSVDEKSDIFAVGVVFYYLFAVQPQKGSPEWPEDIEYVIKKCLMPWPADRYESVVSLVREIERIRAEYIHAHSRGDGKTIEEKERPSTEDVTADVRAHGARTTAKKNRAFHVLVFVLLLCVFAGIFIYSFVDTSRRYRKETSLRRDDLTGNKTVTQEGTGRISAVGKTGRQKSDADRMELPGFANDLLISEHAKLPPAGSASEVNDLLIKAEEQFRKNRFITPLHGNAFLTLTEVLRRDPANDRAKKMIVAIRDIYMAQGEEALRNGSYFIAKSYFERALHVHPGFSPAREKIKEADSLLIERDQIER